MENNELYRFIDLPVSVFMQHAEEDAESTNFADMPVAMFMHCDVDEIDDDIVEHSGIKGMKWGIRRYQNKDGSLTPAGKKRYAKELSNVRSAEKVVKTKQATKSKIDKLNARKKAVEDAEDELDASAKKSKAESKPKTVKEMTNEELEAAKKRLELERDYAKVYKEVNPQKTTRGQKFMNKFKDESVDKLSGAFADLLGQTSKAILAETINKVLNSTLDPDGDGKKQYVYSNNKKKDK